MPQTALAAKIVAAPRTATAATPEVATYSSFDALAPIVPPAEGLESEADTSVDVARQADRFVPDRPSTTLTDKRGKVIRARIINVSATGVAIEADFDTWPAASIALVGQKPVHLGRTIRRGQVFLFEKPLDPARCNPQVVL